MHSLLLLVLLLQNAPAGNAHPEETAALDRPAEAEGVEDRLLTEDRLPALEPGDAVGVLVKEEERVTGDVAGEEPVFAQEADRQPSGT
jgi:hypothetical protein